MLFIWILITKNVVDDFECSTDKRERFYDPMDPGLWVGLIQKPIFDVKVVRHNIPTKIRFLLIIFQILM